LDAVTALNKAEEYFSKKKKRAAEYCVELKENAVFKIRRMSGGSNSDEESAAVDSHGMEVSIVSSGLKQLLDQIKIEDEIKTKVYTTIMSSLNKKSENKHLKRLSKKNRSARNKSAVDEQLDGAVGGETEVYEETDDDKGFEMTMAAAAAVEFEVATVTEAEFEAAAAAAAAVEFEVTTVTEAEFEAAAAAAAVFDGGDQQEGNQVKEDDDVQKKESKEEDNKKGREWDGGEGKDTLPPFVKSTVGAVFARKSRPPPCSPDSGEDAQSASVIFVDEIIKENPDWYVDLAKDTLQGQEPPKALEGMMTEEFVPFPETERHNNTIVLSDSSSSSVLTLPLSDSALRSPLFTLEKHGATPLINSTPDDDKAGNMVENTGNTSSNRNPNPTDLKLREEEEKRIKKKRELWIQKKAIAIETMDLVLPTLLARIDELFQQQTRQMVHLQQQQQQYDPNVAYSFPPLSKIPPPRLPGIS
jgi:hypothetical protein